MACSNILLRFLKALCLQVISALYRSIPITDFSLDEISRCLRMPPYCSSLIAPVRNSDRLLSQEEKNHMLPRVLQRAIAEFILFILCALMSNMYLFSDTNNDADHLFGNIAVSKSLEWIPILSDSNFDNLFPYNFSSGLRFVDYAIVSAIVLSIVFHYLVGYVDKGGTKTYNPGSLEFRANYVSLLLFLGAYVWIKFREVAQRTVRRRPKKDTFGKVLEDESGLVLYYDKWEPRFKPPRETGLLKHDYLPLGGYGTHRDAEVVCQIAAFYYSKDEGAVALADGSHFRIPEMSEHERRLCGQEKRRWVSAKAKAVFREFKQRAAFSANAGEQADARGISPPADPAVVTLPTASDNEFADNLLLSELTPERHDPTIQFNPDDFLNLDAEWAVYQDALAPPTQVSSNEQLNLQREQLEAEFNRRLAQHHRHLEEENSKLRQENKRLRTMLQQAATPLRAFFVTSTVELESSTENC